MAATTVRFRTTGPDPGERFRLLNFFWTSLSECRGWLEFGWAAKPETDTFGHEPALVARCCSPAELLGSPKLVGTPRCNDARRGHQCDWHGQGGQAAMASCRTSEQLRRVSRLTRGMPTSWITQEGVRLYRAIAWPRRGFQGVDNAKA